MNRQMPVKKFRAGAVSCALWENKIRVNGEIKSLLKASIERSYKDSDGVWQSSSSFSRNEIPLAIHCLQKALEAIIDSENERSANRTVEEEVVA